MTTNNTSTVGVFDNLEEAERTMDDLRLAGFSQDEIGIVGNVGNARQAAPAPAAMKAPEENVTNGVVSGGVAGALVGLLVILIIPGLGEVTGVGRWFELLGGLFLGAAVGGFFFAFGSLFLSQNRARFLERQLKSGRYIVTVKSSQRQQEAASVLREHGAYVEKER